ncbi:putative membrane protein SpoIIM required for sporulation [Pedobacter cryoconitis]|uniref:Putative membrane protein SpoIIM required for sporulation n=1 Tax=Pedobacter cryoconitis TaxID=188932 RepID=A0A7W9DYE5_9SPHI|nr:stage II sporulation protein M [Pedobacter cryoconitis]MBB5635903.1 putative membrane protein SpoIIM required for sporulation [Pedobacter cryoconitis]
MREALFVKQNSEKWKAYERSPATSPDEVADRFIDITNDLSYAKTFYPKSKTTVYLNGLASLLHQSIYKNKKEEKNRFVNFWKFELPLLFYTYRLQIAYAFIFFIISASIGALSAKYDDNFIRLILGDSYVNMTNENIAKGDPFGVYKHSSEFPMFFSIAANNIYVSLLMFVSGIFLSIGPIYYLLQNGIMLGSFEYYFFSKGLGTESILVIWIHGTLEISAIIIAGAAGLVLGHGLLFPKTYTRFQAFKQSAKDGTKIALGLIPILLIAAFFEGFITRHTEMPLWLSISILGVSLVFIIWYVILYPSILSKRNQTHKNV